MHFKKVFLSFALLASSVVLGQTTAGLAIHNIVLPYDFAENEMEKMDTEIANKTTSSTEDPIERSLEDDFFYHVLKQENITVNQQNEEVTEWPITAATDKINDATVEYVDTIFADRFSTPSWNELMATTEHSSSSTDYNDEVPIEFGTTPTVLVESTLNDPKIRQPTDNPPTRSSDLLKQMKMQFILDCALLQERLKNQDPAVLNALLSTPTPPPRTTSSRNTLKTVTTPKPPSKKPQTPPPPVKKANKPKVQVENVEEYPGPISEISDVFENIYNYLEEAFTTKVVESTPTRTNNKQPSSAVFQFNQYTAPPTVTTRKLGNGTPIRHRRRRVPIRPGQIRRPAVALTKQNVVQFRPKRTTFPPISRITKRQIVNNGIGTANHKKNSLTTQIHVTSEYTGPDPTDSIEDINRKKLSRPKPSDEDDYYDDGFSFDDFSLDDDGGGSDESSKEDYVNYATRKTKRRKNSKIIYKKDDSDEDAVDDDEDYETYENREEESPGMFSGFLETFISTIVNIFPTFGWFSRRFQQDGEEARSTTPRIDMRRPKNPLIYGAGDAANADGNVENLSAADDTIGWFNPFSAEDELLPTTPMTPEATTDSSDFWNWFGSGEETTTIEPAVKPNRTGWFFGSWFGGNEPYSAAAPATTTTTRRPFLTISNPLHNPQAWIGVLAQHLATSSTTTARPGLGKIDKRRKYDNYQLWRIVPATMEQVSFLTEYRSTAEGAKLQWWKGPTLRGPTDIVLPPDAINDVRESLQYEEIPYDIIIWDLEKAIEYENPQQTTEERVELSRKQGHPMTWYRYHRYDDIVRFMDNLQQQHSKLVELIHIGRSFEGRPLTIVKISAEHDPTLLNWKDEPRKKRPQRSAVFLEAGSHAREWIAPAVATWILNQLVNGIHRNDSVGETIRSMDWYIMPVLNPDGYEYSHETDRLWRKTRSKHDDDSQSLLSVALNWIRKEEPKKQEDDSKQCYGTDPNRNWNYRWNEAGASQSPCSDVYAGPRSFSEPETKALSKFLMEHKKNFKLFLSLHAYGQLISYPTTANSSFNSMKSDDLLEMAQIGVEALRGSGTSARYNVDAAGEMFPARSGSVDAFAMYSAGIKYAYTVELRDTGTHGYLLPPSYIEAAAKDTFELIKGMIDFI